MLIDIIGGEADTGIAVVFDTTADTVAAVFAAAAAAAADKNALTVWFDELVMCWVGELVVAVLPAVNVVIDGSV